MGGGEAGEKNYNGAPAAQGESMIEGIDISRYQDHFDFKAAAAAGKKFCGIKATDGKSVDPLFAGRLKQSTDAGMYPLAYHYFRFAYGPKDQADHFVHITGGVHKGELPHMLDVEWDRYSSRYAEPNTIGGTYSSDGKKLLTKGDLNGVHQVLACLEEIERLTGVTPILYTNAYYFCDFPISKDLEKALSRFPLWVPSYAVKTIDKVKLPAPWRAAKFWQYSESLKLGGADAVDGDRFLGSLEELQAMVKK